MDRLRSVAIIPHAKFHKVLPPSQQVPKAFNQATNVRLEMRESAWQMVRV